MDIPHRWIFFFIVELVSNVCVCCVVFVVLVLVASAKFKNTDDFFLEYMCVGFVSRLCSYQGKVSDINQQHLLNPFCPVPEKALSFSASL